MRLENYMMKEELSDDERKIRARNDSTRKKSRDNLTKGLRNLEDHIKKFIEEIENEIDKIEDSPMFQEKLSLMVSNIEKEEGEYILALRQIIHTLGKKSSMIPQVRAHMKNNRRDDKENVRDTIDKEESEEDRKNE